MKATGLVRRIDDLGRVVIPKEIRITLSIREGDTLEIFTEQDSVCFKKYSVEHEEIIPAIENIITDVYEEEKPYRKEAVEFLRKAKELIENYEEENYNVKN